MNDDNVVDALYGDAVYVEYSSGMNLCDDAVILTVARESQAPVIQRIFLSAPAARELAQILVREAAGN